MKPQETVERVLALSRADGCVVLVTEASEANLRWASNTLTTNGVMRTRRVAVVSIVNGTAGMSAGVVERSTADPDRLEDLVRAAEQAARDAGPAEDAEPLVTPAQAPAAGPYDDPPVETSIQVFDSFAKDLGESFRSAQAAGRALFGFAEHQTDTTYLGSSTGLRLRHDQAQGRLEANAKTADFARSVWAGRASRDFADVDVAEVDAELTQRLAWTARRLDLPAGRYETLLPPSAVADLLVYLYWSAAGRDAEEGRTVFSRAGGGTRVGERLSSLPVTLRSDPSLPGLACSPFVTATYGGSASSVFDNGLALSGTDWVRDGVLSALMHSRHSAAVSGAPVTPPVDNLQLAGPAGGRSLAEMVEATGRGLLLTCLWYIREVDPQSLLLTGLTRDGLFLVEDGEVVGAVNNFRFNESPVSLLARMTEVGATERTLPREWSDYFQRTAMPPVRVPDFNMSSVSRAS